MNLTTVATWTSIRTRSATICSIVLFSLALAIGGNCSADITKIIPDDSHYLRDDFGSNLKLDGNTLVVGSPGHNQIGLAGLSRGAAYVYRRSATGWNLIDKLIPSDGQAAANFGAVAIDGSTIVVGDANHTLATPMGTIGFSGAAYVFQESAVGWNEVVKLTASDARRQDYFGAHVAIDNDTIMVGTNSLGDLAATSRPAVFVFENDDGQWAQRQMLIPSVGDGGLNGSFGMDIVIEGQRALVGAGTQDNTFTNSGAVFAYEENELGWQETQVLYPGDPITRGRFGISVAVSGNTAMIGRPGGSPGTPANGAVYVFENQGGSWIETAKLEASDGFVNDRFGSQVAIAGPFAAVSAWGRDVDNVYLFESIGGSWVETGRLSSGLDFDEDHFGIDLTLDVETLAIGAPLDSEAGDSVGAVYVAQIPEPTNVSLMFLAVPCLVVRARHRG